MKPNKENLSSEEAAALLLSGGQTKNPREAEHIASGGDGLNLDELQRAHLRRLMGFDFSITVRNKKISVFSTVEPYVTSWCGYNGTMDERAIDKLIVTCLRLKKKYEATKAKETV
jgi:hypothetical protein